jgi:hypothetical protein
MGSPTYSAGLKVQLAKKHIRELESALTDFKSFKPYKVLRPLHGRAALSIRAVDIGRYSNKLDERTIAEPLYDL